MVALGETVAQNGQELLAEFVQYGHQKPFEEIVRRYAGMVFNVCFRITKDKHEAEDATQAVFLTLALQAKRGTDIKALGPWLQQVAKRLALDNRRSKKRRQNREERHQQETTFRRECIDDLALPSADLDELKTILHEELQKMPTKYRLPLILHYFGGLSREEMAAELNCKPSTLGVRIFRGREMLAGRLSGRGINISAAMLATMMGYAVKRAISETLIASTSHVATAMAMGHSGAGIASANVIGLTRKASGALAIGKVKVAAFTMLLAGTSLGAGAKALGILPTINIQRMISNQVQRLMRPMYHPFNGALRVDARPTTQTPTLTQTLAASSSTDFLAPLPRSIPTSVARSPINASSTKGSTSDQTVLASAISLSPASAWTGPDSPSGSSLHSTPSASISSADISSAKLTAIHADASESGSSVGGAGGGASVDSAEFNRMMNATSIFTKSSGESLDAMSAVAITTNDLIVGSPSIASRSLKNSPSIASSANTATPVQIVQVLAIGGSVTQSSAGIIRGWGKIDRTGTLDVNGEVIADGQGVDRTLNLTSFTAVQTQTSGVSTATPSNTADATTSTPSVNSPVAVAAVISESNGWFAVNHGRLELPLEASNTSSSTLTWGDNPDSSHLSLVNSVRLHMSSTANSTDADADTQPEELALLSPDRSDAPRLSEIDGVAIGLWELNPGTDDTASADLSICYDNALLNELGASASSLQIWTLSGTADNWQPVGLDSLEVDADNHLVSGYAGDFSYFALSVIPEAGEDASHIVAHHLAQTSAGGTASVVPEPTALSLLGVVTLGSLGRRRRKAL